MIPIALIVAFFVVIFAFALLARKEHSKVDSFVEGLVEGLVDLFHKERSFHEEDGVFIVKASFRRAVILYPSGVALLLVLNHFLPWSELGSVKTYVAVCAVAFFFVRDVFLAKNLTCTPSYIEWGPLKIKAKDIGYIGIDTESPGGSVLHLSRIHQLLVIKLKEPKLYGHSLQTCKNLDKRYDVTIKASTLACEPKALHHYLQEKYMSTSQNEVNAQST